MDIFDNVREFNVQYGVVPENHVVTSPMTNPNILTTSEDLVKNAAHLIDEELGELHKAITDKKIVEVADALGDLMYVIIGMALRLGIDFKLVFQKIHENNMAKFDLDEEAAKRSVEKYHRLYDESINSTDDEVLKQRKNWDSPAYRLAADGKRYVIFNENTKKVLKSSAYVPVDLSFLLPQTQ